ncbi:MAG: hypothetical protein ACN0LA_00640 [Candidatus Longimicrobiales bacterium M2_2A_002]
MLSGLPSTAIVSSMARAAPVAGFHPSTTVQPIHTPAASDR